MKHEHHLTRLKASQKTITSMALQADVIFFSMICFHRAFFLNIRVSCEGIMHDQDTLYTKESCLQYNIPGVYPAATMVTKLYMGVTSIDLDTVIHTQSRVLSNAIHSLASRYGI